jgi:hypothetical protein
MVNLDKGVQAREKDQVVDQCSMCALSSARMLLQAMLEYTQGVFAHCGVSKSTKKCKKKNREGTCAKTWMR